jgi:hypothetical protein
VVDPSHSMETIDGMDLASGSSLMVLEGRL